jgi:hypothetical protein
MVVKLDMEINYTNQIRFLLTRTNVLIDIFYDNSKGMCHAMKHAKVKAYKPIPNIDGTEDLLPMPEFFNDNDAMMTKAHQLIMKDRRGTLGKGMSI